VKEKGTDPLLAVNAINSGRVLTHACHSLVRMVEVLRIWWSILIMSKLTMF